MKKTILTLTVVLALGIMSTVSKPVITETTINDLQEFAIECTNDEGFYQVYYVAPKPVSYEEEVKMCKYPSLHMKW